MIDIHTHILPGIDDGSQDMEESLEMARMAAECGVGTMIATPHCNLGGSMDNYYNSSWQRVFDRTAAAIRAEGIPLTLLAGMEVFATFDLPSLLREGRILTLNRSSYLLVEFDFEEEEGFVRAILEKLVDMRLIPVIAHGERYHFMQDMPELADLFRKMGCHIQVNRGSFQGRFGPDAERTAYELMDRQQIWAVASDAHGALRRTPVLDEVRQELLDSYPRQQVHALFTTNPRILCDAQKSPGR